MPYGLTCTLSVFQNLINDILQDMLGKFITAYIDGILIYLADFETPVRRIFSLEVHTFHQFYYLLISEFSSFLAILTTLLKGNMQRLKWNSAAEEAFSQMKTAFTTAPVLKNPDPSNHFIIEVEVSNIGVGTIWA